MSLPLETAESPFKNKNSLGQVLVDGNQLDISNINCYLQLLAQTANKKEKLRRKKRRERREKKKKGNSSSSGSSGGSGSSSKERRRSRREREGKEKEIEPDVPVGTDSPIKSEPFPTATDEHGLTLAPTLPSHGSQHPNSAMGRRAASSPITPTPADSAFEHSLTHSLAPPARSSSWSQFIIDHTQQQQQHDAMSGYMSVSSSPHMVSNPNLYPQSSFLHRSSPTSGLYNNPMSGQPSFVQQLVHHHQQQQPIFDPAAEFIQFMTEHQSSSNPSFTFSSSFSSDALSPITDESFMGFPTMSRSPFLPQHVPINASGFGAMPQQLGPADSLMSSHGLQMHQPPSAGTCYAQDFAGLLTTSTPTSSFGMEPIDDRDGTFASLEFLEAALAQDMRDA